MASSNDTIVIPFQPVLTDLCKLLNFGTPIYFILNPETNHAGVSITTGLGPVSYIYRGGQADTVENSCEMASMNAVRDLTTKYNVYVEDVTSMKKESFEKCAALYQLKQEELTRYGVGFSMMYTPVDLYVGPVDVPLTLSIDFVTVVRLIINKFGIRTTAIDTVRQPYGRFIAWLTVVPPSDPAGCDCIFSDDCKTPAEAKQSLAKKIISYLSPVYKFVVVDVNHESTTNSAASKLCSLERERYLAVVEGVLGIKTQYSPSSNLEEQDCVTPRGSAHRLSVETCPILPRPNRKLEKDERNVGNTSTAAVVTQISDAQWSDLVFGIDIKQHGNN